MTATQTSRRAPGEEVARRDSTPLSVFEVHDALGRAHYERMRVAMAGNFLLPPWEDLAEGTRVAHRERMRWVLPVALGLTREAAARNDLAWQEAS